MATLNDYLRTRYVRGGRGPVDLDCWGLVRLGRVDLFGRALLPLLTDAEPGNLRAITKAFDEVSAQGFADVCKPRAGAIATAWRASLCVHVGLVVEADNRLMILETDEPTGPCLTPINTFTARYTRVLFYDDQNLPEHAARRSAGDARVERDDCWLLFGAGD